MTFPDVRLTRRPLHFIYLCDCSGSMQANGKIQSLNQAIRQSLPAMVKVSEDNPEAAILVRVVSFSDQARWHIGEPTPVGAMQRAWVDLQAGGLTAMGQALQLVGAALRTPPMEQRALPPVLVLISDGAPTDDFKGALRSLMREPWARKAVRLAIAIGHDADLEELQRFIELDPEAADGNPGGGPGGDRMPGGGLGGDRLPGQKGARRPLQANNANALASYIQWASTVVIGAVSQPLSEAGERRTDTNVPLPDLPPTELDPNMIDPNEPW
ncbi:MAG: vWA domain-containing protein [Cyanobium sp.]